MFQEKQTIKVNSGRYKIPVVIEPQNGRLYLQFRYNPQFMEEVKAMEGARYHGFDKANPRKVWSILDTQRNQFQLSYLAGENPYSWYDRPLLDYQTARPLREHQIEMVRHIITYRQMGIAGEMGVGKTLAAICGLEYAYSLNKKISLWVGPKSALYSVQLEFDKWEAKIRPEFITYESLKKYVENMADPPFFVCGDECSRIKNPTAQRSIAFRTLADLMRQTYGKDAFIVLMSGTPAPKSPVDWWHLCEVPCPGFLREGTQEKFKRRLGLIKEEEGQAGGWYPKLITWKDDENKCNKCGQLKDHDCHNSIDENYHPFEQSKNEVLYLYSRMKGLWDVKLKKDCLDLPDMQFKVIRCKPSSSILHASKMITMQSPSVIKALILNRELSDGFQYENQEVGFEKCPLCKGTKVQPHPYDIDNPDKSLTWMEIQSGYHQIPELDDSGFETGIYSQGDKVNVAFRNGPCDHCSGTGEIVSFSRKIVEVECPKDQVLKEILDEHEEVGRLVTYGGFTGSVDRIIRTVESQKWQWLCIDGRGLRSSYASDPKDALRQFMFPKESDFDQICFVGQPGAGGMGLNLTCSPTVVFFSNDFNAESRAQAMARVHRMGMDYNLGATCIDILHLPTDEYVLNSIMRKIKLQDMSMGELTSSIHTLEKELERTN